ncbi:hypothetical protein N0O92_17735 [Alkalihalobacillus sp. MEB130]|uniref:hypothetical protein n=1 Tax=Alkalihalobacillus sp. MEB130 TaxID=2976704 RepID=UPI0028E07506|nr:hypothetical protein [Alkalihalobacillus sp. MEB130]MDT8862055.1 hypothetical protein [Alkalihalobacillus sp. MEB130]
MTKFSFEKYPDLLDDIITGIYEAYPELEEKFGERGKVKCKEDNEHHFNYLETAFLLNQPKIFTDYAIWLNNVLVSRGMKSSHLIDNFERIHVAIANKMKDDRDRLNQFSSYLQAAISELRDQE